MQNYDINHISELIYNDAGLRLLRSRNPALLISFFYKTFRENHKQTIPAEKFEQHLVYFLGEHIDKAGLSAFDSIDSLDDFADESQDGNSIIQSIEERAHFLVNKWCQDNIGYIRRYYNMQNEPVIELSASVDRALTWIDNMNSTGFIAAESRFQDILHRLRELSENVTQDTETRIAELKKRRQELNEQIKKIEKTGKAEIYTPVQMQERLYEVSKASRELLSDFKQVEENFRAILSDIYKKQAQENNKGEILGYALDADEQMGETPQGQTFHSFWMFLAADAGKNEINQLTRAILHQVSELGVEVNEDTFLLHLKQYLHEAGKKIIDENHILAERLNRVLLSENRNEHKRLVELIHEIKKSAIKLSDTPPKDNNFMEIETKPYLNFPQARTVIQPSIEKKFEPIKSFNATETLDTLLKHSGIFNQFYIDERKLKSNINEYREKFTATGVQFSLSQLIEKFPIEKGLAEVLTYFTIASKLHTSTLLENKTEVISYVYNNQKIKLKIPKLIFV